MSPLVLRTATRGLVLLLGLVSLFLLIRGHNEPGGGFIGGLVAVAAVALALIAFGVDAVRRRVRVHPRHLLGVGLAIAALSGVIALVAGAPYMTGLWVEIPLPGDDFKLGTPLLFDIGVYMAVIGFALSIIWTLEREA